MERKKVTIDGNEAAAYTAFKTNEVIAIYPITPSSNMGEWCDAWAALEKRNIWNTIIKVSELQSEGGASGSIHGALQSGALSTTFTASQGLLLMIPNMYKIAGELTSTVFHVSARSVATHALSIFGDHSDVMATRPTGFALLSSNNAQEVMDLALIAQAATLESRVPFLHFFDGFRTSHEVLKIEELTNDDMHAMIDDELVHAHRSRALSPDNPFIRGTAQNPDVFFQGRETINPYYIACPDIVQKQMDRFAKLTGRKYNLFDYVGVTDAEKIIIMMGSGADAAEETVNYLNEKGEKLGLIKVRLYRPFSVDHFINALPKSTKSIAVLDRTKEAGAPGEPLYLDVVNAISEKYMNDELKINFPKIIGGRYGLSSKEFTPAMVKAVFDNLSNPKPKAHFTVGINEDVTNSSLDFDPEFSIEAKDTFRGMFFGLGADGTVGANKNSIKIIGEGTDNFAQGYFVYDSKKSGSMTISHLRFGPKEIKSTYLINQANFIACHQTEFLEKMDVLKNAIEGTTFLLNTNISKDKIWDTLPQKVQEDLIKKKMKLFIIDAYKVASETGMGARINTIMQTCFFAISSIFPKDEAINMIKDSIKKSYGAKGEKIVQMNFNAVDQTLAHLYEVEVESKVTSNKQIEFPIPDDAPEFIKEVTGKIIAGEGDLVPVSKFPVDGTYPSETTKWEKRNIALQVPVWDTITCIQCNKCVNVCPHATIRTKIYHKNEIKDLPPKTFKATKYRSKDYGEGLYYSLQVAVEDCTGCALCVDVCPAKNKKETRLKAINMEDQLPLRDEERANWDYFLKLPELDRTKVNVTKVKDSQFLEPLFEFSGACSGCGETPYVKLASQLFGDRMIIANATGCSSIYGGNLPTTPWAINNEGRGPVWSNSLFEDNAEFGFGYRLAIDKHNEHAKELLQKLSSDIGSGLVEDIINAEQKDEAGIYEQRERVKLLSKKLKDLLSNGTNENTNDIKNLLSISDYLTKKSVWIMGGDGWAYDIGYGGLDHVIAAGRNVNILVLDTEVYSNTGGQMSKATPRAAVAKFAAAGKPTKKKDLGLMAMAYGNVYVAKVAMGANDTQTLRAFLEAEAYDGPSIIIAYSHCIAHGINMEKGMQNQKAAVDSGYWQLYRYNPDLIKEGKNPFKLESKGLKMPFKDYAYMETRYKMLTKSHPERAATLIKEAQQDVVEKWQEYERLVDVYAPNKVDEESKKDKEKIDIVTEA
jgi:pyruvate-ferredoxin/flavodoxin oxidoreductase